MSLVKALIPGIILTFVVSLIIGSNHGKAGFLNIFHTHIQGYDVYWSWPLFFISTAIAWGIFKMME